MAHCSKKPSTTYAASAGWTGTSGDPLLWRRLEGEAAFSASAAACSGDAPSSFRICSSPASCSCALLGLLAPLPFLPFDGLCSATPPCHQHRRQRPLCCECYAARTYFRILVPSGVLMFSCKKGCTQSAATNGISLQC